MKLNRTKLSVILSTAVLIIVLLTNAVFAGLPCDDQANLYCVQPDHGWGGYGVLYNEVKGNGKEIIEPSTGYGLYLSKFENMSTRAKDRMLQEVVWASMQWGNKSNVLDYAPSNTEHLGAWKATSDPENIQSVYLVDEQKERQYELMKKTYRYGTVYYGLIEPALTANSGKGENIFKTTTNANDLKVFVDSVSGTYTVGPYKLELNDDLKKRAEFTAEVSLGEGKQEKDTITHKPAELLYKELVGDYKNFDADKSFAKFTGITGLNGTDAVFINSVGKQIKFPEFKAEKSYAESNEFYIRFKPNYNGAIIETGVPQINITYMTKFLGNKEMWLVDDVNVQDVDVTLDDNNLKINKKTILDYVKNYIKTTDATKLDWKTELQSAVSSRTSGISDVDPSVKTTTSVSQRVNNAVNEDPALKSNNNNTATNTNTNNNETESQQIEYGTTMIETKATYSYDAFPENDNKNWGKGEKEYDIRITLSGKYDKKWQFNSVKEIRDIVKIELKDPKKQEDYQDISKGIKVSYKEIVTEQEDWKQNAVKIYDVDVEIIGEGLPDQPEPGDIENESEICNLKLPGAPINMQLGGKVWLEGGAIKSGDEDGKYGKEDKPFAGITVLLYDATRSNKLEDLKVYYELGGNSLNLRGVPVAVTTTDADGKYRFYGSKAVMDATTDGRNGAQHYESLLNPLHKYYVVFVYNGQVYQPTYYKNNLSGGYSNAKESSTPNTLKPGIVIDRDSFNKQFGTIYSSPANYEVTTWNKAYSMNQKIEDANGKYIAYANNNPDYENEGVLTYWDVFNKYLELASLKTKVGEPSKDDYKKLWNRSVNGQQIVTDLYNWMKDTMHISESDTISIIKFMTDSMIQASTMQSNETLYPKYDKFIVENIDTKSDVYNKQKSIDTLGSRYHYLYTKEYDMARNVDFGLTTRPMNDLALQKDVYKATVIVNGKKEEYIYSKKSLADDGSWTIKTRASDAYYNGTTMYDRPVRESDYLYDSKTHSDGDENRNLQVYVTYRIAIKNQGTVLAKVNEVVDYYDANAYDYVSAYVGKDASAGKSYDIEKSDKGLKDRVGQLQGYTPIYFTNIKSASGKEFLDVDNRGETPEDDKFAYLYVTFKVKNDANGKIQLDQATKGKKNIAEINAYSTNYVKGTIIPDTLGDNDKKTDIVINNETTVAGRIDTDSNPGNITNKDLNEDGRIVVSTDPMLNRSEDDSDQAPNIRVIIDNDPNNIRTISGLAFEDGRTVQSDKAVVGDGIYDNETKINGVTLQLVELVSKIDPNTKLQTGEYLGEHVWSSYVFKEDGTLVGEANNDRYYTGQGNTRVIIGVEGNKELQSKPIENPEGAYAFTSLPAGDFFIRFLYGDNEQTVLTNGNNKVNELLGKSGLNAKSYNGQDYKSTVYQQGIDQSSTYNGIKGYVDYDKQNYTAVDKNTMYYYDIEKSNTPKRVSDAKDVYSRRETVNNWSKTLTNNKAETLASFERLATFVPKDNKEQKTNQQDMINNLINNTYMVAQSGVINVQVEYNRGETKHGDSLDYKLENIDLGLVERPEAGLKLNKEVSNFELRIGERRYSTTKSVDNIFFGQKQPHVVNYTNTGLIREVILGKDVPNAKPQIIQAYVDDEFIKSASVTLSFRISVENVGEVDYKDKQFYYTGVTNNKNEENIAKTNAKQIVDYVANSTNYDPTFQHPNTKWTVTSAGELIKENETDLVNRMYKNEVGSYKVILTSDQLSGDLTPSIVSKNNSSKETTLVLASVTSNGIAMENLVYNNLAELIESSNDVGRRNQYSIAGNEEMADQNLGNDASQFAKSPLSQVEVKEIDADSSQRTVLMPPTGQNQNYTMYIISILMALGLIISAAGYMKFGLNRIQSK